MLAAAPDSAQPFFDSDGTLFLQLFGAFSVCCEGRTLPKLRTRKDLWLLALLVLQGTEAPMERSRLAGMLWPEARESRALSYLRSGLSELRGAMASESWRIKSPTPRTLQLDLSAARCDVVEFDRMARSPDETSLRLVVELYRGPLLEECYEDWIAPERESRRQTMLATLGTLATETTRRGDLAEAIVYLRRALQIDPLNEPLVRRLMQALADQGSHAAAGEAYRAFRLELSRSLHAEPSSQTIQLSRDIRASAQRPVGPVLVTASSAAEPSVISPTTAAKYRLPVTLSSLVGRKAECATVVELARAERLVTLTGTGGAGKTRLALAVAEVLKTDFEDGVCFIDLAAVNDVATIPILILKELGESEPGDGDITATLEGFLRPRNLLLLLDNCEHVLEACADIVGMLLKKCPYLRILATSREPLHVTGESVWPVPGMEGAEAARLFGERASQARYGFQITGANAEAAQRVCKRLEGMPLAIEMAAARVRGMSVPEIAAEMDDVMHLLDLRGGNQDTRQRTLRATLDWSYRLLDIAEQRLLTRLSVFAGGFSLALACGVCSDEMLPTNKIADGILSLVEKSLVEFSETTSGEGRYRLLETTRVYAADVLSTAELARLSDRRVEYFVQLAKALTGMQVTNPTVAENALLLTLETELPNIRAALTWCQSSGSARSGLQIAGNLKRFWWLCGHITEGRHYLQAALSRESDEHDYPAVKAFALRTMGVLASTQWDFAAAQRYYQEALPIERARKNGGDAAWLLHNLGATYHAQGDLVRARAYLADAVELFAAAGDDYGVQWCEQNLANILRTEDNLDGARALYQKILLKNERVGDLRGVGGNLADIASVCRRAAILDASKAVAEARTERGCIVKSLTIYIALADTTDIARCLEQLANLSVRLGKLDRAATLHAAGSAFRNSADGVRLGFEELAAIEEDNRQSREALGDDDFAAAQAVGKAMTAAAALSFAEGCP